jgi:hypothetical protein
MALQYFSYSPPHSGISHILACKEKENPKRNPNIAQVGKAHGKALQEDDYSEITAKQ